MTPHPIELPLPNGHVLMRPMHRSALVIVRAAKQHREEVSNQVVQVGNVTDVLNVENIEGFVIKDGLVETSNNLFDLTVTPELFINGFLSCFVGH